MKQEVSISYPTEFIFDPDEVFRSLAKKHKGRFGGSGCELGGGMRDLQFVFSSQVAALEYVRAVKEAKFEFEPTIEVYDLEE